MRRTPARVTLTRVQIDAALPLVAPGLRKYLWLQAQRQACDLRSDRQFRKDFNGFYRVRRSEKWQDKFYDLLEQNKGKAVSFSEVLDSLYRATSRYEASFSSKLLATIDPNMPVIDSIVMRNVGLALPGHGSSQRAIRIHQLYGELITCMQEFLMTETGGYLVRRFREEYPSADITEVKMLDLVLWQTRARKSP